MSDRWALVLAASAVLGALSPRPLPMALGTSLALGAVLLRRPPLLCLAVLVLAATLSQRAWSGLDGAGEAVSIDGPVTLLTDPSRSPGGVRADARLGRRRVELLASGVAADALRPRLAGEVVTIRGDLGPVPDDAPWLVPRHISAQVRVLLVEGHGPGHWAARAANAARRLLVVGAGSLTATERSLFLGLVVGDDRDQPPTLADDFRGAGLTHLLAVSGQNVAFVIALAMPLLSRLRIWPRWAATLALVGLFGVMTRFEPSVIRASAMAAVAASTAAVGQPAGRLRVLLLTITGLVLVDPLLVHSVGFRLSVAATAAIGVLAERLTEVVPGPLWLRRPLSVTIAAQVGVAPVLLTTFGPMPVAALVANLVAVPLAGAVMVWGLTAGLIAGLVGDPAATVVHLPTRVLLGALAETARRTAALPLGQMGVLPACAIGAALVLRMLAVGGAPSPWTRRLAAALVLGALGGVVAGANASPGLRSELGPGVVRWHAGSTEIVVLGGVGGRSSIGTERLLEELREHGVRSIDLLVLADESVRPSLVPVVAARHPIGATLLGPGLEVASAGPPSLPLPARSQELRVNDLIVVVTPTAERLVVEARRAPAP